MSGSGATASAESQNNGWVRLCMMHQFRPLPTCFPRANVNSAMSAIVVNT